MTAVANLPTAGSPVADGRILLGPQHGEGGMSVVHLATEVGSGRPLAVKLLIERYKGRPERERRLLDEGKYLEQLAGSPLIVELVEYGRLSEFDDWPYVATELMTELSLGHLILRERELPIARIVDLADQLARAIQFVHQRGIVHRDITTSNVFVCGDTDDGVLDRIKLFDFSHAGRLDGARGPRGEGSRLTGEFDVPGTHGYMSPEQARAEPVTTAMDVFAFGAVLYELVTRTPLFDLRNREQYIDLAKRGGLEVPKLQAWAYEIPERLAELVNACTEPRGDGRPSIHGVVEQLGLVRAELGEPPAAPLSHDLTERVRIEQLPQVCRDPLPDPSVEHPDEAGDEPDDDDETVVRLALARRLEKPRALPSVVVWQPRSEALPSASPIDDAELDLAEAKLDQAEHERPAQSNAWIWMVGAGLLLATGLGGWAVVAGQARESRDADAGELQPAPLDSPALADPADTEDSGSNLELVPEIEIVPPVAEPDPTPDPKIPERPRNPDPDKLAKHATPECKTTRSQADAAIASRKWSAVLDHTKRTECWAKPVQPLRLRVQALAQTKAWAACVDAGGSSSDAKVVEWVEFCQIRLQR